MINQVTINTDASFSREYGFGTYAFWITLSETLRIKRCGVLRDPVTQSQQAEIMCIINALFVLYSQNLTGVDNIIVNTDCLDAIHVLEGDRKKILKYNLTMLIPYAVQFRHLRETIPEYNAIPIEFRHVRAHTSVQSKRTFVNDWCDKQAKEQLRRHKLKLNY